MRYLLAPHIFPPPPLPFPSPADDGGRETFQRNQARPVRGIRLRAHQTAKRGRQPPKRWPARSNDTPPSLLPRLASPRTDRTVLRPRAEYFSSHTASGPFAAIPPCAIRDAARRSVHRPQAPSGAMKNGWCC